MIMSFESPQQGNSKQHMRPILLGEMTNIFPVPCEKYAFGAYADSKGSDQPVHLHTDQSFYFPLTKSILSQGMTKPTIRLVRPAKSQISLHIHTVWWVFADRICLLQHPGYLNRDKQEHLPYWMDIQADLSLIVTQILL